MDITEPKKGKPRMDAKQETPKQSIPHDHGDGQGPCYYVHEPGVPAEPKKPGLWSKLGNAGEIPGAKFKISWSTWDAGYTVNIPNYDGGEVVKIEEYDRVCAALTAAREERDGWKNRAEDYETVLDAIREAFGWDSTHWLVMADDAKIQLTKLREERDRAQEALRKIANHSYNDESESAEEVHRVAREALKPVSDRQPEGEKP